MLSHLLHTDCRKKGVSERQTQNRHSPSQSSTAAARPHAHLAGQARPAPLLRGNMRTGVGLGPVWATREEGNAPLPPWVETTEIPCVKHGEKAIAGPGEGWSFLGAGVATNSDARARRGLAVDWTGPHRRVDES